MTNKNAEPLLPVELGAGKVKFAQGIKAGRWVFATGVMAQDFKNGIAPDVLAEDAPHAGLPKREKEALRIWENIDAVLRAAGTDRNNLVRTDQYYATVKAVPAYQHVRREFLAGRVAPSTSVTQQGLLLPGADMNIQALGIIPGPGFEIADVKDERLSSRPTAGFSAALTVGDFIFVPGLTASAKGDEPHRNGVAKAALLADGQQWAGQPIKVETEFIITQRIVPSLALAGATIDDIIHAQVYLTDPEDYSAFNETWSRHFAKRGRRCRSSPSPRMGSRPMTARSRSMCWRRSRAAPRRSAMSTRAFRPHSVTSRKPSRPATSCSCRRRWRSTATAA